MAQTSRHPQSARLPPQQVDARLVAAGEEIARWSGHIGGADPLHVQVCHKP